MAATLWVGTRKGLFRLERSNGHDGWRIAHVAFLAEPVSMVLPDARDGSIYAALNLGHFGVKLHRSTDNGETWTEVAAPSYPKSETGEGPAVKQISALEAAGPDANAGLWAGTLPGGLFFSKDRGASWTLNDALWNHPDKSAWLGGGYDDPAIHSICVDPRDAAHVLAAVSCGGVWRTRDAGGSWSQTAHGMFAEFMPPERRDDPNIQDPHRMVQCPGQPNGLWVQHHNGVFRSTDDGVSWRHVPGIRPSGFGFAVVVHPTDPNTAWFVPATKDERRVPLNGQLVVARTRDGGTSCDVLTHGLPSEHCYDIVYRHAMAIDDLGTTLAMGSTTGHLWTSSDEGDRWSQVPHYLPPIYAVRFAGA